jgi:hypothetical protein
MFGLLPPPVASAVRTSVARYLSGSLVSIPGPVSEEVAGLALTFEAGLEVVFALAVLPVVVVVVCWQAQARMASASVAEKSKGVDGLKAEMRMKDSPYFVLSEQGTGVSISRLGAGKIQSLPLDFTVGFGIEAALLFVEIIF